MLNFGEYLPDVAPLDNPGLVEAQNVVPATSGYQPVPGPSVYSSNAMDARPQGAFSARDMSNNSTIYTFFGDATKLYQFTGSTFTDVSVGGGYTTGAEESWEFIQWGDTVIATNYDDPMQVKTLGGANFANLGGGPPQARHIGIVDNFVVVGNTYDAIDGDQPQRVRWSAIGNSASWTVSATTQADYQDLRNNGGYIQKVVGGDYGLIFQERAITRMSYIGSPLIFQFDEVESERGALAANSVIKVGNNVAYLGQDGFYVFDGNSSIPIGDGKIDETFFNDVDIENLTRMSVAFYPNDNIICWSYVSISATGKIPDTILFYNYSPSSKQRWSYAKINNYLLVNPISTAYTLDSLDTVSTNLDALPEAPPNDISLDSKVWQGSINLLGIVNEDFKLALLNSTPLDGTIITGEAWLEEPRRTFVSMIRPHIERASGTITAQIGVRDLESQQVSFGPVSTMNAQGFIPVRANGRFMRAQFNLSGSYFDAQGFDIITSTPVGRY